MPQTALWGSSLAQRSLSYFKLMHEMIMHWEFRRSTSRRALTAPPCSDRSRTMSLAVSSLHTVTMLGILSWKLEPGYLCGFFSFVLFKIAAIFAYVGSAIKCLVSQNLHSLPRPLKSREGFSRERV